MMLSRTGVARLPALALPRAALCATSPAMAIGGAPPPAASWRARWLHSSAVVRTNAELYPTGTTAHVPQTMINEVTPIVVDGDYVNCNGGGDTLTGHPIEMIKVDSPWPAVCKYCGLRYISREHAHKSAEWAHLVGVRALPPPPMRVFPRLCFGASAADFGLCCPDLFASAASGTWAVSGLTAAVALVSQADPSKGKVYEGVEADSTRRPCSG